MLINTSNSSILLYFLLDSRKPTNTSYFSSLKFLVDSIKSPPFIKRGRKPSTDTQKQDKEN